MAASATGMTGAGVMLLSEDGPQGSLCSTDEVSSFLEELQFTLGEGPGIDAHRTDGPVSEPNLANPELVRWPGFSEPAVESGAEAVFGFPIRIGAARLGALNLYCDRPGLLTAYQHADALVTAEILAEAILAVEADADAGQIAEALEARGNFHYVVHQASGMIATQLDVSVREALVRLRAYAYSSGASVMTTAHAVVDRRLRFDELDDYGNPNCK